MKLFNDDFSVLLVQQMDRLLFYLYPLINLPLSSENIHIFHTFYRFSFIFLISVDINSKALASLLSKA